MKNPCIKTIATDRGEMTVNICRMIGKCESKDCRCKQNTEKIKVAAKSLQDDEKNAYETVADSEGAIFQSELVEKMGYAKVKVTRILDKLEGKGLIDRRRRGLANIVLIRNY